MSQPSFHYTGARIGHIIAQINGAMSKLNFRPRRVRVTED